MTFSSITFVVFFLSVIALLFVIQNLKIEIEKQKKLRFSVLLFASYVFYGWWDWRFCFLLLGVTAVSYLCAVTKEETGDEKKRIRFIFGIATPLIVLGIFKYTNFFLGSFCSLFGIQNPGALSIILPVGISFYTFQALSYNIDVYYGKIEKEKSFLQYALYISFFPQLVAGPIVKANEFLPQLKENRVLTLANLEEGIQIFAFGMFKKIVLADNISVFVDQVYESPTLFGTASVWLAVISYAIQIYLDFSGYSDMAIGCAKCIGYDLTKNFDLPYLSKNMTEFWKRWHISLSTWLQQYLYIPLGGNRKGKKRTYLNLMITMVLGGLWHGSSWNFVLWGALHGAALCVHKLYRSVCKETETSAFRRVADIVLTDLFVCLCWVFFRAQTMPDAMVIFRRLFIPQAGISHMYSWSFIGILFCLIATAVAVVKSGKVGLKRISGFYPKLNLNTIPGLTALITFYLLILGLAYVNGNPFIYFQF